MSLVIRRRAQSISSLHPHSRHWPDCASWFGWVAHPSDYSMQLRPGDSSVQLQESCVAVIALLHVRLPWKASTRIQVATAMTKCICRLCHEGGRMTGVRVELLRALGSPEVPGRISDPHKPHRLPDLATAASSQATSRRPSRGRAGGGRGGGKTRFSLAHPEAAMRKSLFVLHTGRGRSQK